MGAQIYFEDVSEGMELPVEVRNPTPRQLVQYAGASGDFYEIHYDRNFAQSTGLKDIIIHGALKNAMLGAYVTGWAGPAGELRRLTVQYRGMDYPDEPITAKGHVSRVYQEGTVKPGGLHHLARKPRRAADHSGNGNGASAQPRVTFQTNEPNQRTQSQCPIIWKER